MHVLRYYIPLHRFDFRFTGAPQVLRYSVAKEVEAVSGRDVRLEMEVCSDPIPSKTTWDWGSLRVEAGQVSFLIYFGAYGMYLLRDHAIQA